MAAAAAIAAVLVIVVGTAVGASVLRPHAAVNPAVTPSVTPSPAISPSPSVEPTQEPASPDPTGSPLPLPPGCGDELSVLPNSGPLVAGAALPQSVMLTAANWGRCYVIRDDLGGYLLRDPSRAVEPPPYVCPLAAPYAADDFRVAGRVRTFLGGPEVSGYQTVTRYELGRAEPFLAEVRAAVQACATFQTDNGITQYARIVDSGFAGDESLLIYVGDVLSPNENTYPDAYTAVVRVGDVVTVVEPQFDLGGDRTMARTLGQRAAARL